MILDLALAGLMLLATAIGFKRGLIPTLFGAIGYLGGGAAGLFIAKYVSSDWEKVFSIIGLYIGSIFFGSQMGRFVMAKLGSKFRKRAFFGPFRFLDSILGGALSLIQTVIISVVVLTILNFLPISAPKELINESEIYGYFSGFNLLSFQSADLLGSVSSQLDRLKL